MKKKKKRKFYFARYLQYVLVLRVFLGHLLLHYLSIILQFLFNTGTPDKPAHVCYFVYSLIKMIFFGSFKLFKINLGMVNLLYGGVIFTIMYIPTLNIDIIKRRSSCLIFNVFDEVFQRLKISQCSRLYYDPYKLNWNSRVLLFVQDFAR